MGNEQDGGENVDVVDVDGEFHAGGLFPPRAWFANVRVQAFAPGNAPVAGSGDETEVPPCCPIFMGPSGVEGRTGGPEGFLLCGRSWRCGRGGSIGCGIRRRITSVLERWRANPDMEA